MPDQSTWENEAKAVVDRFYSCLRFEPGGAIDFEQLLRLFHVDARITPPLADTNGNLQPMSSKQFAEKYAAIFKDLQDRGAREYELESSISCFKSTCNIMSTYQFSTMDGTINRRGVNSFQLVRDTDRWWIVSLIWDRY